ncbi:MAG: type II secretion system protein GspJ [Candidatus Aerophobetes bacterium]|nr:type II secretion system protein GspJ [Candidatus Aerophobetes bacterium]
MREKRKGFTLIEVILATSILAFLLATLYYIFWKSSSAWEKGNARIRMYQKSRACLDMMSREIKTAFISRGNPCLKLKGDKGRLTFISTSNKIGEKGEYDLCEIEYSLSNSNLQRRIRASLDPDSKKKGATNTIASNVMNLSFSYNGNDGWQESWDSTMGTEDNTSNDVLPQLVRITLTTYDEREKKDLTLSTVITLPMRE